MALTVEALTNCASYVSNTLTPSRFGNRVPMEQMDAGQFLLFVITFLIVLYIFMLLGAFIFNNSVVKVMPSIKRVSVMDFFGLYIVLHILFC
jgi:hypothetical protein